jgi:SNF2 family DNA or RNA helicase
MIRSLARKSKVREILSGTMLTANPLAAWSQFEILEKGALGFDKYADFKWHYGVFETVEARGRSFNKLVDFKNLPDLRERISKWTSVVLRSDTDMPDLLFETVKFKGTPQQIALYEELRESFILDLETHSISVGERAPRLQKMQQVFSGFVNDDMKARHVIPGENPRLDATAHQCFLAPGKFIVWCEFQADIDFVTKRLRADGMTVVEYHGRVSDSKKSANLKAFNSDPAIDGFVGHVQAGGRGLDISVASTIVYHSHTFKARMRAQSVERASKIGGGNIRVIDIVGPGPDKYILKTTSKRIDINDAVAGRGLRTLLEGLGVAA